MLTAAQADRDRRRGEAVGDLGLLEAVEELHVDAVGLDASLDQFVPQIGHHLDRATQEPLVHRVSVQLQAEPQRELPAVNATAEMCRVSRVPGAHVDDPEPVGVTRLEVVQLVAEHGAVGVPVAVDQGEAALGLDGKRRLQDREDRGDAAAGGNCHIVLCRDWVERRAERTRRCHQLERVARPAASPSRTWRTPRQGCA